MLVDFIVCMCKCDDNKPVENNATEVRIFKALGH